MCTIRGSHGETLSHHPTSTNKKDTTTNLTAYTAGIVKAKLKPMVLFWGAVTGIEPRVLHLLDMCFST
jgi:hypothetical protein